MAKMTKVECDGRKLSRLLKLKGVGVTEASCGAGYSASYLSNSFRNGWLSKPMAAYLEDAYGISPDMYSCEKASHDAELKHYFEMYGKAMIMQVNALRKVSEQLDEIAYELHRLGKPYLRRAE